MIQIPSLHLHRTLEETLSLARDVRERVTGGALGIFGQHRQALIDLMLTCLFAGGHLLIDGEPGSGQTMVFDGFAKIFAVIYRKIPLTADLWHANVLGHTVVTDRDSGMEYFKPGPIFANLVLLNGLDRASPRLRAPLMDVLSDGKIVVDGDTYSQLSPFMACATTSNGSDNDSYPVTREEFDLFLLSIEMESPLQEEITEMLISDNETGPPGSPEIEASDVIVLQQLARSVAVPAQIIEKIASITVWTRNGDISRRHLAGGLSPRGALALKRATQAIALVQGRLNASMDDLRSLVRPVLRHRLSLNFSARADGINVDDIIEELIRHAF